jgi:hypothetical protein
VIAMEDLGKISETFLIVDRYTDYLYRKAWGKVLTIWGILLPLAIIIFTFNTQISITLAIEEKFLKFITTTFTILLGTSSTLYIFLSVPNVKLSAKEEEEDTSIFSHYHGVVMGLMWFVLFQIPNYIIEPFNIISYLIVSSIALISSYIFLQKVHGKYKELLISGIILLISIAPLLLMLFLDLGILANIATAIVFACSFLSGGLYSMYVAGKILDGSV